MADWMNWAALVCAAVASTAFGLLSAYGILCAGFRWMRPLPKQQAVKAELNVATGR